MASSDNPQEPPVRFPKNTTITFRPSQYRDLVERFRQLGMYPEALKALEENEVVIVLRSNNADGVTNAIARIQDEMLKRGATIPDADFVRRIIRVANPTPNPRATEGCPIGKFLVA